MLFDGDGWLAYCNPAFAEMTGWQADRVIGMMNLAAFDANFALQCDPAQTYEPITGITAVGADAADNGQGLAGDEATLTLARPMRRAMRRTLTETGETILFFHDVTRETEVDRMKSEFLTTAAHELIDSTLGSLMVPGDACQVDLRLEHAGAAIHVDAEKTRQALLNVISNAYKYSPAGGVIEVTVLQAERRGRPSVGIRVRDQGIGMTPFQLQRVCERFYRADPSGNIPGTGLGMPLVKETIELQGGNVQIDSELGAGTRVTLWLPLATEAMTGHQELAAA